MRLAAGVEYDGSAFYGWQRQRQSPTVQACLETALGGIANHPVVVHGSGRTDTGVHARCQVFHFDTSARRSERSWVLGANSSLHSAASLLWVRRVDERFHARHSAASRRYRYRILNRRVRPALDRGQLAWCRQPLDVERMACAGQALLGEHDFSSFRAAGCQSISPVRSVHRFDVTRTGSEVFIDIEANAFVYHMVRNIVGSLIMIGTGEQPETWLETLLAARDRTVAGPTAPARGLCFEASRYPDYPALPIDQASDFPEDDRTS